jgi:hypothetical protein
VKQLGSAIEQVTALASHVLAVAHILAASAVLAVAHNSLELDLAAFVVLVVDHNTGESGFAASAAVGSNRSALVARSRLVFATPEERHRLEVPSAASRHRGK